MRNLIRAFTVITIIFFLLEESAIGKQLPYSKLIKLDKQCSLDIHETNNSAVVVVLKCLGSDQTEIDVDWAGVDESNVQHIRVQKDEFVYFITAWDRSSTYGYQTNIVVWKNYSTWDMYQAPFTRGFAEDRDSDGIYEFVDYYPKEIWYVFENGRFKVH